MPIAESVFIPDIDISPRFKICLEAGDADSLGKLLASWKPEELKQTQRDVRRYFIEGCRHLQKTFADMQAGLERRNQLTARSTIDLEQRRRRWQQSLAVVCIEIDEELEKALARRAESRP